MGDGVKKAPGMDLVEISWMLFLSATLSFRLFSLPILCVAVILSGLNGRRSRRAVAARRLFLVSLLSPVDIDLGIYRHRSDGRPRPVPRLARCVAGMPAHTDMILRYGEYYWLGCSGMSIYCPRRVLVLF